MTTDTTATTTETSAFTTPSTLRCTADAAPGRKCGAVLQPETAWVPSIDAMRNASDGKPVRSTDLANFVICGSCGHRLRSTGIYVYRLLQTQAHMLAHEAKRKERKERKERKVERKAEDLTFKLYAARFAPKKVDKGQKAEPPKS